MSAAEWLSQKPVWMSQDVVVKDAEFDRINNLPRRLSPPVNVEALSAYLRTPDGKETLRLSQAETLYDAYLMRGAVGVIGTGRGKTASSLLLPMLPHPQDPRRPWVERPLLIVKGALQTKAELTDIPRYRAHWRLHPNQKIISYSLLQTPTQKNILWRLMPDLIVCDEAQAFRNRKGSRAQRLENYLKDYPNTIVVMLSASLFKRKLKDAAHLFWYALKENSPLPRPGSSTLDDWGKVLDEGQDTSYRVGAGIGPGALYSFCASSTETPKSGFRRRMREAPGVIVDFISSCDSALNIFGISPERVPPAIVAAFHKMQKDKRTPSDDELTDHFNIWRRSREIAYGFYYRWVWPGGIPDVEWLYARAEWRRFVRYILKHNRRGIDTEKTVRDAVDAGIYGHPKNHGPEEGAGAHGALKLAEWRRVHKRWDPSPPKETIWIDRYIAQSCADWLNEPPAKGATSTGRLCWVEHDALGKEISRLGNVPYFGGGDDGVERYKGPCVLSIMANSEGRNLQDRYWDNLFACAPPGGDVMEQAISRTHRDGQPEDEVNVQILLHCRALWECFAQARRDARHQEDITGQEQKLNLATISALTEHEVYGRLATSSDPLWSMTS